MNVLLWKSYGDNNIFDISSECRILKIIDALICDISCYNDDELISLVEKIKSKDIDNLTKLKKIVQLLQQEAELDWFEYGSGIYKVN